MAKAEADTNASNKVKHAIFSWFRFICLQGKARLTFKPGEDSNAIV
jgi:hypothetical protein